MTDEEKRVIQAARTLIQSHVMDTGHGLELQDAVNALDAAPAPSWTYLVAYVFRGGSGSTAISFRLEPTWGDIMDALREAPGMPVNVAPTSACRIASPRA